MPSDTPAITIQDAAKRYGPVMAVSSVSLEVRQGELFGLIGPDGAGKTTLMRALCTLLALDSGTMRILGLDTARHVSEIRKIVGYMPQRFSLYQDLTVEQNLRFFGNLFQVSGEDQRRRAEQLYRFSRLAPFRKRKAGALSGGMKQKLALSCALIHTPQVLILDEPTYGVDPVSRQEFWEILHSIRQEGATILISTAYMDEADHCDRVALIHEGVIRISGTPLEVKQTYHYPLYRVTGRDLRTLRDFLDGLDQVHSTQMFGDAVHVSFHDHPAAQDWERWQADAAGNILGRVVQAPSIEDVFLEVTEAGA